MNNYESVIIMKSQIEDKEKIVEDYKNLIKSFSNEEIGIDVVGERKLAYDIKKEKTGYYVVFNYFSEPENIYELERKFRIDDNILKFITVKRDDYIKNRQKVSKVEKNRKIDNEMER